MVRLDKPFVANVPCFCPHSPVNLSSRQLLAFLGRRYRDNVAQQIAPWPRASQPSPTIFLVRSMIDTALLTAETFLDSLYDLPDGGQWVELVRGRVETMSPPEDDHRVVVLNLSKFFAEYMNRNTDGYPCFDLGLVVSRNPDTVRFPAVSYFLGGEMFGESDQTITETRPALVIELLSSNDRRRTLNDRIHDYTLAGITVMWFVDPFDKAVHIIRPGYPNKSVREDEALCGSLAWQHKASGLSILPEFRISVAELFKVPESWEKS